MRRVFVSLVVAAAAVGAACDAKDDGEATTDAVRLASEMCSAAEAARDGDVDAARERFEDNHAGLHALADDVSENDRQRAGELLRAKQEVESVLDRASAARLADLLRELAVATATARGGGPPSCA